MNCEGATCDVIDECRCYADESFGNPRRDQICGKKLRGMIIPCKPGCCPGGCPGQCTNVESREPFGFGKMSDMRAFTRIIAALFVLAILTLIYLKILRL